MRLCVLIIISTFIFAHAYSITQQNSGHRYSNLSYKEAILILQGLDAIDGKKVGIGGTEGKFYALSLCMLPNIDTGRTSELLSSKNPNLRVMGLLVLALSNDPIQNSKLKQFRSDTASIMVFNYGCTGMLMDVGMVASLLIDNPYFFGNGPEDNPYGIDNKKKQ
ncbi:MAG: hypothetical protein ABR936_15155 [Bacteroidota bacterium]|jgi:hypothetical protein